MVREGVILSFCGAGAHVTYPSPSFLRDAEAFICLLFTSDDFVHTRNTGTDLVGLPDETQTNELVERDVKMMTSSRWAT